MWQTFSGDDSCTHSRDVPTKCCHRPRMNSFVSKLPAKICVDIIIAISPSECSSECVSECASEFGRVLGLLGPISSFETLALQRPIVRTCRDSMPGGQDSGSSGGGSERIRLRAVIYFIVSILLYTLPEREKKEADDIVHVSFQAVIQR